MSNSGKNKPKNNLCQFCPPGQAAGKRINIQDSSIVGLAENVKNESQKFISRELGVVSSTHLGKMRFLAFCLLAAGILMVLLYGWFGSGEENKAWLKGSQRCLAVAIPCDLTDIDPAAASNSLASQVLSPVFDTLVKIEDGIVLPNLAKNWTCSANGKVWTFNLRSEVFFHDGTQLSAQIIVDWIQRLIREKDRRFGFFRANFDGERPLLAEVKSLDKFTVQFVLNYPCADFLELMAAPSMAVTVYVKEADGSEKVYGSGPFVVVERRIGQRLTLRSSSRCWRGKPSVDEIVFIVITDPQSRIRELERGNVDIVLTLPADKIAQIKKNKNLRLIKPKTLTKLSLVPNCTHRPFNDVRARLALSFAIPRKTVLQMFFGGRGQVRHALFSPLSWAQVPSKLQTEYSAVKAKRMFSRIYGNGSEFGKLTLLYCKNVYAAADLEPTAEFLASCLNSTGLNTELYGATPEEYRRALAGNLYDLCLVAEEVPACDPSLEANKMLAEPGVVHGEYNISNYSSQRILRLLEAARSTKSRQERLECYKAVQAKLDNDAMEFNIGWTDLVHACRKNVHDLDPDRWGVLHFENAVIS